MGSKFKNSNPSRGPQEADGRLERIGLIAILPSSRGRFDSSRRLYFSDLRGIGGFPKAVSLDQGAVLDT
jgi:hypothetical protein